MLGVREVRDLPRYFPTARPGYSNSPNVTSREIDRLMAGA